MMLARALELGERLSEPLARDARAQRAGLGETGHRPWPPPDGPWLQGQTWHELLFAHWALPVEALRPHVPDALPIDTFDGRAWLGVTPFRVSGLRPHGTPPPPLVSSFLETNVRTYVTLEDKPGIWFFSLDASSLLAVLGARAGFRLPYFRAAMTATCDGDRIAYRTRRGGAALAIDYAPTGCVFEARPGTLEHFLTERYCLYAVAGGRVRRAEIHHAPWPLQPAEAEIAENTMTAPLEVRLPPEPPFLHYARRQDVVVWPPRTVQAARMRSGAR